MQIFVDPTSPRHQLRFEQLPRGIVQFPQHIVDAVARERTRFAPEIYTDDYARKSMEAQTLSWYYEGLPVAYKRVADGIDVLGVGWEETAKYASSSDPSIHVVQA